MSDSQMNIGTAGSVNPNATSVNDTYNFYGTALPTRMDAYFQSLLKEIENGITEDVFDALDYYKTKLDGTKDLEEKLTDGPPVKDCRSNTTQGNVRQDSHAVRLLSFCPEDNPFPVCSHQT